MLVNMKDALSIFRSIAKSSECYDIFSTKNKIFIECKVRRIDYICIMINKLPIALTVNTVVENLDCIQL